MHTIYRFYHTYNHFAVVGTNSITNDQFATQTHQANFEGIVNYSVAI